MSVARRRVVAMTDAALKSLDAAKVGAMFENAALKSLDAAKVGAMFAALTTSGLDAHERENLDNEIAAYVAAVSAPLVFLLICVAIYLEHPTESELLLDAAAVLTWSWMLAVWMLRTVRDSDE